MTFIGQFTITDAEDALEVAEILSSLREVEKVKVTHIQPRPEPRPPTPTQPQPQTRSTGMPITQQPKK